MQGYRQLEVWQLGMGLSVAIYQATEDLPKHELYELTSQLRRAAVSIPANIAEGYGRNGAKEYAQFVGVACGSQMELATLLDLCTRLYPTHSFEEAIGMNDRCGQMLGRLRAAIVAKSRT